MTIPNASRIWDDGAGSPGAVAWEYKQATCDYFEIAELCNAYAGDGSQPSPNEVVFRIEFGKVTADG